MNFEDDAHIYLVRDTVTGGYVTSSKYWCIGLSSLGPKSKAHIYGVQKTANALRNKAGRQFENNHSNVQWQITNNPPTDQRRIDEISEIVNDWQKRKSLPNFGFETLKIKI